MEQDRETQNYLLLQQGQKLPPRARRGDNGEVKDLAALKEKRKAKKIAKKNKTTTRGILGSHNLFNNPEEKFIYNEHYRLLREMIIERKGEVSFADEVLATDFCVARLRQFRKTRLESHFNRFFDRQCPQDPISQTTAILKALGLTTEKNKDSTNNKELMMKLLGKEAENIENSTELEYHEWAHLQSAAEVKMERFAPNEIPTYYTEVLDVSNDSEVEAS